MFAFRSFVPGDEPKIEEVDEETSGRGVRALAIFQFQVWGGVGAGDVRAWQQNRGLHFRCSRIAAGKEKEKEEKKKKTKTLGGRVDESNGSEMLF